ncbi:winged helix-turn-helix transcriptional regulator [Sphingomonas oligophenolica]|uniref:Transcriptional regulator n=1 Tax=Sphingomonas oligophenolica TaxID=301154 RepID=A0A502BWM4_9SPHN|nr:helix-turn-helix domain-containing protein [Sphingomonas oligophenolica]TPG04910.1 transcriptional regulator [Sphingomonas oligophenolica]
MQWNAIGEQDCSMARTLAIIGDRWTLLILRECFLRVRRFDDFQERLGIGRPILTDRLQKLVDSFVLTKVAYQQKPTRYEYRLTPKGLDLYPVVLSIVHWGDIHLSGRRGRPVLHEHVSCGHIFDPVTTCSACAEALDPRDVRVLPGPGLRDAQRLPRERDVATKPERVRPVSRS